MSIMKKQLDKLNTLEDSFKFEVVINPSKRTLLLECATELAGHYVGTGFVSDTDNGQWLLDSE